MLEAIFWASLIVVAGRFALAILVFTYIGKEPPTELWGEHFLMALGFSLTIPFHALGGYLETWTAPWKIDDCGDRLERLIASPRGVEFREKESDSVGPLDGLSPHEVMGLGPYFTLAELSHARRQLVKRYHPDRRRHKGSEKYAAAEDAVKRVNAAYDDLRPSAA